MAPPFPSLNTPAKAVYPVAPEDLPDLGEDHTFETMAIWNRKGGVAKTTLCQALGFAYALKGRRVLMVDSDPQCDLSCLLLQEWVKYNQANEATEDGSVDYDLFYNHQVSGRAMKNNLRTALEPVIMHSGATSPLVDWAPADVTKIELPAVCDGALFLLPGHHYITDYEDKIGIAYGTNLHLEAAAPGGWNKLMGLTARKCGADIVLVDCNPHVGLLNMHIVLTSNYLLLPCTPDFQSQNAIKALPSILRAWTKTINRVRHSQAHSEKLAPDLQIPGGNPRILGVSVMKFTHRNQEPAGSFKHWIDLLEVALREGSKKIHDTPALAGMAGTMGEPETWPTILVKVHDFTSLGALSHYYGNPVFALGPNHMCYWKDDKMNKLSGKPKREMMRSVMKFQVLFKSFLQNVGSKVVTGPFRVSWVNGNTSGGDATDSDTALEQPGQDIQEGNNDHDGSPQVG